jgi:hypothetical protein
MMSAAHLDSWKEKAKLASRVRKVRHQRQLGSANYVICYCAYSLGGALCQYLAGPLSPVGVR